MLEILEKFVQKQEYKFLKMDGTTAISSRQHLITEFNSVSKIVTLQYRAIMHTFALYIYIYIYSCKIDDLSCLGIFERCRRLAK